MLRLVFPFGRSSDGSLFAKAQAIVTACTGNPNLPANAAQLVALITAFNEYNAALAAADLGLKSDIIIKNQKKQALVFALIVMGNLVASVANDDAAIVATTGFQVAKGKSPLPPVDKPVISKLIDGANEGELEVFCNAVKNARLLIFQITPDPLTAASVWTSQPATTSRMLFTGLVSGQKYWVRVVAYGVGGQEVIGDPVSRIVQ